MSYLGTDAGSVASGVVGAVGGAISSIAGAILDYRAIGYQQEITGAVRQRGMASVVEQEEYRRWQEQLDSEVARAEAEARSAAEGALQEQEEQIQREILSLRTSRLREHAGVAHGAGRTVGPLLWWVLGLGGVGVAIGAAVLLSRAGD